MLAHKNFTVAKDGTTSDFQYEPGHELIALIVPALDSATIGFSVAADGVAANAKVVYTNTHGAAPAALNLGTADTGGKTVAIPYEVSRISAAAPIRLVLGAAQNTAARTIIGLWAKVD